MTFLSPGPALTAAAIALPVLLLLYVLKLRRRPLRASTIAFWQAASADAQANVPFQRLRASWMLALHLLLLACLLLALARPVLDADGSMGPQRMVLLVDASASMSARDSLDGGAITSDTLTRLERAKRRAKEIVREARRGPRTPSIAVVAIGAQSEAVLGFSTSGPMLDAAIEGIEATDQPGDLVGALRLVQSLAAEASSTEQEGSANTAAAPKKENAADPAARASTVSAVLLSDGSFAAMPGTQTGSQIGSQPQELDGFESSGGRAMLPPVPLRFERVGPPMPAPAQANAPTVPAAGGTAARNVGIVRLAAQRDAKQPSKVRLLVAVSNNAAEEAPVALTIALDGVEVQRSATVVPAAPAANQNTADDAADEAAAGTPAKPAELDVDGAKDAKPAVVDRVVEVSSVQLGVREIVLDVADVASGVLSVVLDSSGAPDALASDNTASLYLAPQRSPSIVVLRSQAAASEANTLRFLLTDVLEELRPARLEQRVLSASENVDDQLRSDAAWADVAILDDLSLKQTPGIPVIILGGDAPALGVARTGELAPWTGLIYWDRQHPLLQGVGLDSLVLGKRMPFALPRRGDEGAQSAWRHDVLVRDGDDPLVVLAQPRILADGAGVRHIIAGFPLVESNWPLSPSFAIFLANAIDSLSLRDASRVGKGLTTAAGGQVRVPAAGSVTLNGPVSRLLRSEGDPASQGVVASASAPAVLLPTGILPKAGIYRIEHAAGSAEEGVERVLAVNVVNAHESALVSPRELRFEGKGVSLQTGGASQRELWPTLLIIAVVLLTLEWVVFARQTRA